MERCPRCGDFMRFHMEYCCGSPYIFYTCNCGYDTRNAYTTWTATTNPQGAVGDGYILRMGLDMTQAY